RDIKPDNIFLCDPGSGEIFVKLLDFGIAKSNDAIANANQTNTGAVMGTPYYMSPEQMVGAKHVDHRSDLWSLGVVAYFCITGSRPFTGDTYGALAIAIHSGPMPAPSALNPMLSPAVDAWFFKACARDPNQRFSSARELAEAFAAATGSAMGTGAFAAQTGSGFVATGAAPAAPTGAPLTSTSPETVVKKRSSAGLFAGIGVVLLLVLGVGGFFLFGRKEPTPATPAGEAKEKPEKLEKAEKPAPSAKASASEEPSAAPAESVEELPAQADPVPSMKKPKAVPSAAPSMAPSIKAVPKPKGKYDDDIK
ncbi:MAG: serine/threonine protein kinase, partial [Polyangiales bacterium]